MRVPSDVVSDARTQRNRLREVLHGDAQSHYISCNWIHAMANTEIPMSQTGHKESTLPYYPIRSGVQSLRQLRLTESSSFSVDIHFNPFSVVQSRSSLCRQSPRLEWVEG